MQSNPPSFHQLAAIMFTDVVGYTAMMQRNEEEAVRVVNRHQAVLEATVPSFGGRILQYYGDGSLTLFPSATDAVRCASALQLQFQQVPAVPLRIGLHVGEVFIEDGRYYGDGVNISARLQAEAEEGTIYCSEALYQAVKNKPSIRADFVGERILKNVEEPVKVYRINAEMDMEDASPPAPAFRSPKAHKPRLLMSLGILLLAAAALLLWIRLQTAHRVTDRSIAVLPFDNFSEDKEANEFLANGLHEAILNQLAQIGELEVKSRSSVEQYREKRPAMTEIGRSLQAANILEGSIQRIGNRLRVILQLIDSETDNHFWSKEYVREITDIFALQSEIAEEVARELAVRLSPEQKVRLETPPTHNFKAYQLFLQGREFQKRYSNLREPGDIERALQFYRDALQADPAFALAYVGIATSYYVQYGWRPEAAQEKFDSIPFLLEKALEIDPQLAEAYFALGALALSSEGDLPKAKQYLLQGLKWNPNSVEIHRTLGAVFRIGNDPENAIRHFKKAILLERGAELALIYDNLGWVYQNLCDFEQAQLYFRRSRQLNPTSPGALTSQYMVWNVQGQFDSVLANAEQLVALYPDHELSLFWMANAHMELGHYDQARTHYEKLYSLPGDQQRWHFHDSRHRYGYVLWQLGDREKARQQLNQQEAYYLSLVKDTPGPWQVLTYDLAGIHAFLGERDEAIRWLKEYEAFGWLAGFPYYIQVDRLFDPLRGDPEFEAMVRRAVEEKTRQREHIRKLEEQGLL